MSVIKKEVNVSRLWKVEPVGMAQGKDAIPRRVKVTIIGFVEVTSQQEWQAIKSARAHDKILPMVVMEVQT